MLLKFSEALSDKQNIGFLICLYSAKVIYINNQYIKFYSEVRLYLCTL